LEFKGLVKLYIIRGLSLVFALSLFFIGPISCSALASNKNGALNAVGFAIGIVCILGAIALIAVAIAAKHILFKDAYNNRSYNAVDITYRRKR
jgi:hypothetical protein